MTAEAKRVLEAAMQLAEAERAELAVILADSLGDEAPEAEVESAWIAEAKRRLDDLRSGRAQAVPSEEVEHELEQLIAEHESSRSAG